MLNLAVLFLISYLIGSFPTGVIMGFLTQKKDIRELGSGNTGATNSFRVLGAGAGMVVALVDFFKGFFVVAVVSGWVIFPSIDIPKSVLFIILTLAAVIGHVKPVFTGFRGGMGFNTAAGAVTAFLPILAPFCLFIFFLSLTLTGHVAFSAVITALLLPPLYLLITAFSSSIYFDPIIFGFFIFTLLLIVFSVKRKALEYLRGEADLFEKIMIFKRRKEK